MIQIQWIDINFNREGDDKTYYNHKNGSMYTPYLGLMGWNVFILYFVGNLDYVYVVYYVLTHWIYNTPSPLYSIL